MNNTPENPPDFLLQTFLILQAIFRRRLVKDDPQVRLEDGHLFLNREELKLPAAHLSEAQLKDRVRELARRIGLPDVSAHPLAEIWRVELAERSLSASELVECGRFASFQRNPHEADLAKRWRDEFMPRLANHLPDLNAVERFDDSATPQDREKKIELAPILEDWPRRILEDSYWKYAESPLPEMEPLALDDVWVDLFLSDPLEPLEEGRLAESFEMRDERQRWLTEPAAFVLERIYGATALIGPPGCGKTTLLKWFARQLIANPQGRFLLPLFVPLRKYARARFDNTSAPPGDLLEFALRQCGIIHPAQLRMWTTTISYLTGGDRSRVLMMLDGWDEVPAEYRDLLLKEIDDLAYGFAILITSRPSGFPRLLPVNHFYEIASLSHDSSERLIRRWFAAAGVEAQAEAVLHHLDEHPDLRRLARNPFLLSLLCSICRRQTEYTDVSRTSLYRQAINLIVAHHNRQHPRAITSLEQRQIERLALWLQADAPNAPRYVFDRADAQACLNETASLEAVLPSRLLSQLHLDQESFHFLHTTFQEYLAARGLLAETPTRVEQRLHQRAYDLNWQEILCFAAGEAGDEKIKRVFWQRLAAMAGQPDRFGLIFVRLTRFVAEAGVDDGGKALLGVDLREELWRAIERGIEVNTFVDAYAEVDPAELLEQIKERLDDSCDDATRARYLRAMGRVKSRENSQALVNTILQGDDNAAAIASYTGHRVLDAEGFNALRAAVGDETLSERQRIRAMRTLANLRDSSVTAVLRRIATSADHSLSIEAIKALGRIGDGAASSALCELLSEAGDSTRQVLLISALGDARDPVARDRLIEEIVSRLPDDPLVPAVLEALAAKPFYAGTETVAELLKCDDPRVRAAAAQAMGDSARTVYGHELARIALEDAEKSVRLAALRSLVNQGGPQAIYSLAQIVNGGSRDTNEQAEALTTSLLVFARLNATRDTASLSVLQRLMLSALQPPTGELALAAASHAHVLGDEVAERLLEICQEEEASDAVREASCQSLARIFSTWRNRDHELKPKAADALLELTQREPNARNDEESPNFDARSRLAQAAAHALADLDATRLLRVPGTTSLNALAAFSVRTGCLVFEDRIIAAAGAAFAAEAEVAVSNTDHYDIALSFAGQDRRFAEELAAALRERGVKVFYDADESFDLWGKDLYAHLADLYQNRAHFCVMFLSRHYATALWTNHERKAAQARAFRESREFILPIRLDDTPIEGVLDTTAFMRWEEYGAERVADTIVEKLRSVSAI
ncbi:MAG: HEAT repeat domain-containing protein [Burkholderiales bacterium]